MIDGITEAAAIEEDLPSDAQLATVDAVFEDGLTLILMGRPQQRRSITNATLLLRFSLEIA